MPLCQREKTQWAGGRQRLGTNRECLKDAPSSPLSGSAATLISSPRGCSAPYPREIGYEACRVKGPDRQGSGTARGGSFFCASRQLTRAPRAGPPSQGRSLSLFTSDGLRDCLSLSASDVPLPTWAQPRMKRGQVSITKCAICGSQSTTAIPPAARNGPKGTATRACANVESASASLSLTSSRR